MTLAGVDVKWSVIIMDLLGPDFFSTLWMKEQVLHRGYPVSVVQAGHHHAQQIDRQSALQTAEKENTDRIPFTLTFHPHNHAVKSIVLKNLNYSKTIQRLTLSFRNPLLFHSNVKKNTGNFLVKSSFQTNDQSGTFKCARSQCKTCSFIHNEEEISEPKRSIDPPIPLRVPPL